MSGPITDLAVLAREYAVEGWTWEIAASNGRAILVSSYGEPTVDHEAHCDELGELACHASMPFESWPFDPPARVAITVCCAHLGVPTPWRAGELLTGAMQATGDYTISEVARMLRGEQP